MPEINDIELRSEAVQEIIGRPPHWLIRWGITVVFLLLMAILFGSWFISYPDVVEGSAVITSTSPSISVISPASGKLKTLYFQDESTVNQGAIIAELESPFSAQQLDYLSSILFQVSDIESNKIRPEFYNSLDLGSLNEAHLNLIAAVDQWLHWENEKFSEHQISQIKFQLEQQKKLTSIIHRELEIGEQDLATATQVFEVNKKLYEQGATAKLEFLNEESNYRAKQSAFEQLKKQKIQSELSVNALEKQLFDAQFDLSKQKRELLQSIKLIQKQISLEIEFWKQGSALIAPTNGVLHFASLLNANQYLNAGDLLFQVVPKSDSLFAIAEIPEAGFGKVAIEQKAFIRLANFPYQEFGQIEARVLDDTPISKDGNYRVKLGLPYQLNSTYKKALPYTSELNGQVRIITKDRNLLQRIFEQLMKIMER